MAFPSASRADQTDVDGQTGKLAYVAEHTHQAARRMPGGSYKLFDLIILPQDTIRPIRSIRGRNTKRKHSGAWRALL